MRSAPRSQVVVLCHAYPFGLHETFLEQEMPYLAEAFTAVGL